jgi:hypothetical protein
MATEARVCDAHNALDQGLDRRYGETGISAVAAALIYRTDTTSRSPHSVSDNRAARWHTTEPSPRTIYRSEPWCEGCCGQHPDRTCWI